MQMVERRQQTMQGSSKAFAVATSPKHLALFV